MASEYTLYEKYLGIFMEQTGLSEEALRSIGEHGSDLFDAEFKLHGPSAYQYSLVQPIRNFWYMDKTMCGREERLARFNVIPPVLDYGCGIGYTLAWLAEEQGLEDLYGWDASEIQRRLIKPYDKELGFTMLEAPKGSYNTILCINVLEHLEDPMATLEELRGMLTPGGKLLANCDESEGPAHIASQEARRAVNQSLFDLGQHYASESWTSR